MKKLSVCMIVKNEQDVLARCLNCVKSFADEIIVVDTGSTDNTKEISKNFGALVYDFEWCDDFSKARNFSFSKANGDYIMWLDADDVIPKSEQEKIIGLKLALNETYCPDVIMCYYVASVDENGKPDFYYKRERIIKNNAGFIWQEPVHECIAPFGQIENSNIYIYHKKVHATQPKRNLKIYQKLEREKAHFSPRALYYYGRELHYNKYYKKSNKILQKFLTTNGWVENKIDACSIISQNYLYLNDNYNAKKYLFNAFLYDKPRSKTCCEIANIFKQELDFATAKYWYKIALNTPASNSGWIESKYSNFIPAIELCVCCFNLGEKQSAKHYHELSKKYAPNSPAVLYNEKFFDNI